MGAALVFGWAKDIEHNRKFLAECAAVHSVFPYDYGRGTKILSFSYWSHLQHPDRHPLFVGFSDHETAQQAANYGLNFLKGTISQ